MTVPELQETNSTNIFYKHDFNYKKKEKNCIQHFTERSIRMLLLTC